MNRRRNLSSNEVLIELSVPVINLGVCVRQVSLYTPHDGRTVTEGVDQEVDTAVEDGQEVTK